MTLAIEGLITTLHPGAIEILVNGEANDQDEIALNEGDIVTLVEGDEFAMTVGAFVAPVEVNVERQDEEDVPPPPPIDPLAPVGVLNLDRPAEDEVVELDRELDEAFDADAAQAEAQAELDRQQAEADAEAARDREAAEAQAQADAEAEEQAQAEEDERLDAEARAEQERLQAEADAQAQGDELARLAALAAATRADAQAQAERAEAARARQAELANAQAQADEAQADADAAQAEADRLQAEADEEEAALARQREDPPGPSIWRRRLRMGLLALVIGLLCALFALCAGFGGQEIYDWMTAPGPTPVIVTPAPTPAPVVIPPTPAPVPITPVVTFDGSVKTIGSVSTLMCEHGFNDEAEDSTVGAPYGVGTFLVNVTIPLGDGTSEKHEMYPVKVSANGGCLTADGTPFNFDLRPGAYGSEWKWIESDGTTISLEQGTDKVRIRSVGSTR